jgi:hypothetical protein
MPREPRLVVRVDHHDRVVIARRLALYQQRDVPDNDRAGRRGTGPFGQERSDAGMNDRVERRPPLGIREDDGAERLAVQRSVRADHAVPELLDDRVEALGARLDDAPGRQVRVDHRGAVRGEPAEHLALAGADAPGQADVERSCDLLRRPRGSPLVLELCHDL